MLLRDAVRTSRSVVAGRIRGFSQRLGATDRGLSTALNYVLVLGIVSILVTSLLAGFGGLVANQQEDAARAQLEVIGNRIAADVGQVNTLATGDDGHDQTIRTDLPTRVLGSTYTVTITQPYADTELYDLTLSTGPDETTVTVRFRSERQVDSPVTFHGGPLVIEYNEANDKVAISRA